MPCVRVSHLVLWWQLNETTKLSPYFSEIDFAHWLLPRDGVISSYVIEAEDGSGRITGFFSYYHLPSQVIDNPKVC